MTLLATYESPLGNAISLHHADGEFWTEQQPNGRVYTGSYQVTCSGPMRVYCDREQAHEHWEYAMRYGRLHAAWPRGKA